MRFGGSSKPPHHLPRSGAAAAAKLAKDPAAEKAMWSAVALQQHITRGLMHEGRLGDAPRPSVQREGNLSLAQKMGLAPRPAPAPEESEWKQAEAMSKYRDDALGSCSICCELLIARGAGDRSSSSSVSPAAAAGASGGLLITNCSHVFHERCLKQFDRFSRQAGHRKQCPMCRREGYYSRPYRAGAAIVQRHAVVKLQAWARGLAARRSYLAARLQSNPGFHSDYYYTKLRRYADAMLCRAMQREKTVDDVIAEATHRSALARLMLLDSDDWDAIRANTFRRHAGSGATSSATEAAPPQSGAVDACFDCPICLGAVQPMTRPASAPVSSGPGFRLERVPDAPLNPRVPPTVPAAKAKVGRSVARPAVSMGRQPATAAGAAGGHRSGAKSAAGAAGGGRNAALPTSTRKQPSNSASSKQRGVVPSSAPKNEPPALAPMRVVFDPAPAVPATPAKIPTGRDGVVTSCGHCFHAQCIAAFERHAGAAPFGAGQQQQHSGAGGPPETLEIAKCPCCRAVYASAPFFPPRSGAGMGGPAAANM